MKLIKNRKLFAGLSALVLTLSGLAFAGNSFYNVKWASPGSCVIPRTGYESHIKTARPYLTMPATGSTFANAYCPVNPDTGIYPADFIKLQAKVLKGSTTDRVRVYLKEYKVDSGLTFTRLAVDRNTLPTSSATQLLNDDDWSAGWSFDDPNSVFFIEVYMNKSASTAAPRLYSMSITGDLQ